MHCYNCILKTVFKHVFHTYILKILFLFCRYLAGRLNIVSQSESKGLATYVGTFALPSLIFLSLARVDFTTVNWTFLLAILLAKGSVFFAVIIVTALVSRPMNLGQAGLYAIFCTQSNDFALGYPISKYLLAWYMYNLVKAPYSYGLWLFLWVMFVHMPRI